MRKKKKPPGGNGVGGGDGQGEFDFEGQREGMRRKEEGMGRVKRHTPGWWWDWGNWYLETMAEPFNPEQLRAVIGDPPNHANAMGSLFGHAVRAKRIRLLERYQATRPRSHGCSLVWYVRVRREVKEDDVVEVEME